MRKQLFILLLLIPLCARAQRETMSINDNWKFSVRNIPQSVNPDYNDKDWEKINLPHTWNIDAYTNKDYHRGTCWYRRQLTIPDSLKGKELFLTFEGINSLAEVFINENSVGTHEGGYTSFTLNITNAVSYGAINTISVKVNNQNTDIPPLSGDFTIFGGIYRDVWLTIAEKQHFSLADHGSESIYIETPRVTEQSAEIAIRGQIHNAAQNTESFNINARILDPQNRQVSQQNIKIKVEKNAPTPFNINKITISQPQLWSPDEPRLYSLEITLTDPKSKELKDRITIPFGLRWFSVDTQNGFRLNGKPIKLMGVCRHQDQIPAGTALPDEAHRRDIRLAKEMGANFIRISHYPQDKAILDECDRLGLLVWEEIPIVDIISTSQKFEDNCKTALKEMIRQHYNHPSIVMWGYMNEAVIQVQYKVAKEQRDEHYTKTVELARELEQLLRKEDSSRLSVMAFHGNLIYNEIGLSEVTDIAGWNLYQGWYEKDFRSFDQFVDNQYAINPKKPLIISEFGAGSDKRLQSLNPEIFDFSIQWQQQLLEYYLPAIQKRKFIVGASEWNFIDFSSASRQEATPLINNKGLLYNDRTPKDIYYYFQAFLRNDIPVLHIATDDWAVRTVVSDSAKTVHPIKVYSNMETLSLSVNGKSLGEKSPDNFHATWNVPLTSGENIIRVSGQKAGETNHQEKTIRLKTIPDKITSQNAEGFELAINAGSNCYFTDNLSGLTWLPDRPYQPRGWGYIGGNIFRKNSDRIGTTSDIKATRNTPLFQTMRENPEAYRFDVPNGTYEVELSFADLYNAPKKEAYDLAKEQNRPLENNSFDIYINDRKVTGSFSPFAEAGNNVAFQKKYLVTVENGYIQIQLKPIQGNSFINAVKINRK